MKLRTNFSKYTSSCFNYIQTKRVTVQGTALLQKLLFYLSRNSLPSMEHNGSPHS